MSSNASSASGTVYSELQLGPQSARYCAPACGVFGMHQSASKFVSILPVLFAVEYGHAACMALVRVSAVAGSLGF